MISKLRQTQSLLSLQIREEKKQIFAQRPKCPFCNHNKVHSIGIRTNIHHYRCTKCKKSFNERTGTSLWWLHHRTTFQKYANEMLSVGHIPLRKMAKNFQISLKTAFDWRHKILAALHVSNDAFIGLTELKTTNIPISFKGYKKTVNPDSKNHPVHIFIAACHQSHAKMTKTRIGKLQPNDIFPHFPPEIDQNCVITCRYNNVIHQFAKKYCSAIHFFSNDNNPHTLDDKLTQELAFNLKFLLSHKTHGVGTKYLNHYASLALIQSGKSFPSKNFQLKSLVSLNRKAWQGFTNADAIYSQFRQKFSDIDFSYGVNRTWKHAGDWSKSFPSSDSS